MFNINDFSNKSTPNIFSFQLLSKKGFSLIRLKGKIPVESNWTQYCEKCRKFEEIGFLPGDNAGVTCGPASGVLMIDVANSELFKSTCNEHDWIVAETYTITTGNNGTHYYFRYPNDGKEYGNKSFKKWGFDIRGKGGQVVAPGSIHPKTDKQYQCKNGSIESIAKAPDWLLNLYEERKSFPKLTNIINAKFDTSDGFDRLPIGLPERIKELITKGTPKGKRSEAIMSVVDSLVNTGLSDEQIVSVFQNYPIGEKYIEKGNTKDNWLQFHIDKAREFVNNDIKEDIKLQLPSSLPEFPLYYFPECYQKTITEIAEAISTPIEIPALALISLIGASIGFTRFIIGKEKWEEHPNLYIAIIGRSGIGKTPAVNVIFKHAHKIEEQWYNEYKGNTDSSISAPKQLIVDDITTEALSHALEANPKGILWYRDELSGIFKDLDKYTTGKEGGTMSRLMSAYDSGSWKVNRVDKEKDVYIPHATLSIFGTIQPRAIPEIFSKRDIEIGFIPRFLMVIVEHDKPALWTDNVVSHETEGIIANLINTVIKYDFDIDGKPKGVKLAPDAKRAYTEWFDKIAIESWMDVDMELRTTVVKKTQAQCLRLALIAHCMQAVASGTSELEPITKDTIQKAIHLADYFKEHKYKVMELILTGKAVLIPPIVKRVAHAIIELELEIINCMIATSRVTEKVNNGCEEKFHLKSPQVGKAAVKLGLITQQMPDGKSRGIVVQKKDIERLKSLLGVLSETSEVSENE